MQQRKYRSLRICQLLQIRKKFNIFLALRDTIDILIIPHFAMRSHNLREAAKADGRHFVMTPQLLTEYNAIKTLLMSTDVVHHPDFALSFIVMADASEVGLGGVLAQRHAKINCECMAWSKWLKSPMLLFRELCVPRKRDGQ